MTYYRRGRSRTPEVYEGYGVEGVYKPLPSITSKEAIQNKKQGNIQHAYDARRSIEANVTNRLQDNISNSPRKRGRTPSQDMKQFQEQRTNTNNLNRQHFQPRSGPHTNTNGTYYNCNPNPTQNYNSHSRRDHNSSFSSRHGNFPPRYQNQNRSDSRLLEGYDSSGYEIAQHKTNLSSSANVQKRPSQNNESTLIVNTFIRTQNMAATARSASKERYGPPLLSYAYGSSSSKKSANGPESERLSYNSKEKTRQHSTRNESFSNSKPLNIAIFTDESDNEDNLDILAKSSSAKTQETKRRKRSVSRNISPTSNAKTLVKESATKVRSRSVETSSKKALRSITPEQTMQEAGRRSRSQTRRQTNQDNVNHRDHDHTIQIDRFSLFEHITTDIEYHHQWLLRMQHSIEEIIGLLKQKKKESETVDVDVDVEE